jgi:hypothetical protein
MKVAPAMPMRWKRMAWFASFGVAVLLFIWMKDRIRSHLAHFHGPLPYVGFVCEVILRKPLLIAQTA